MVCHMSRGWCVTCLEVVSRDVINEILRLYANATFSCMSGGIPAEPMKFEISCDRT